MMSALLLGQLGCSNPSTEVKKDNPQGLYREANRLMHIGQDDEAIKNYQSLLAKFEDTEYGNSTHLQLALLYKRQEKWKEAAQQAQLFLVRNPQGHLAPEAMMISIEALYQQGFHGIFFPTRDANQDMQPSRDLIVQYQRFLFLYRNNSHLPRATEYYQIAKQDLAAYDQVVGDFYYQRGFFDAAIRRYQRALNRYGANPKRNEVVQALITAYRSNGQADQAVELEAVHQALQ